jgi:adenosylcobinamide-phosphate synthase
MQTLLLEDGLIVLLGAIVLDILFGEPRTYFHPAYLMRRSAVYFEPAFRKIGSRKLGGALLLLTISISFVAPAAIILYFLLPFRLIYVLFSLVLFKYTFSVSKISEEVMQITEPLEAGNLDEARVFAAKFTKSDLSGISESQICSVVIERISSRLVNDVVSPFFYFSIFGVLAPFLTRVVANMDSIFGQKNRKNYEFGKSIALTHSIFNYVPSRLSSGLIYISAELLNYRVSSLPLRKLRSIPESANMGWPIAAFSSSLNLKLEKPGLHVVNESGFEPTVRDVRRATRIYYISFYTMLILAIVLMTVVLYFI